MKVQFVRLVARLRRQIQTIPGTQKIQIQILESSFVAHKIMLNCCRLMFKLIQEAAMKQ
ncbi:hypothetical protein SS50377_23483 [Spironucleus salmonicida]|uniref:Uncharacterized protein n=1 Tax=Spironucleus salmonicida TaxID=348837 RepID=A0A9P8LSR4_9EUKA|nr:hypothetical protein SS50377_23483 [Spironucleus salmonicida]